MSLGSFVPDQRGVRPRAAGRKLRVLTINRHTAYLYLLSRTGHEFLVAGGWERDARPLPDNITLVPEVSIAEAARESDVAVSHGIGRDLASLLRWGPVGVPVVQVIHGHLNRRAGFLSARRLAKLAYAHSLLCSLARRDRARFVFISDYDRRPWPMRGEVIDHGVPTDEMRTYRGHVAQLLVVGNRLDRAHFDGRALSHLRKRLPVRVVGSTPHDEQARPAESWTHLRELYASHRAYVNITREPEKGYNLATLEAMASGCPVVALDHPFTPVVHGVNGYLARGPEDLVSRCRELLASRERATELGARARETARERFGMGSFVQAWNRVLEGVLCR